MHNKPHTPEARAKMSAARRAQPLKWGDLPKEDIIRRLLETSATARSLASEYGCSDSTIKAIFREGTTEGQRIAAKYRKQRESLKGYTHPPSFGQAHSDRMKGEKNPFFGRKHSAEFAQRQSERKKGVPKTLEQRVAQSAGQQGIPVSQWTGFKSDDSKLARKTTQYAAWRTAVFERDDYTCRMCGKRGSDLHPHHIKTFAKHPELRYVVSNGVTLCASPCHQKTKGKEEQFEPLFSPQ